MFNEGITTFKVCMTMIKMCVTTFKVCIAVIKMFITMFKVCITIIKRGHYSVADWTARFPHASPTHSPGLGSPEVFSKSKDPRILWPQGAQDRQDRCRRENVLGVCEGCWGVCVTVTGTESVTRDSDRDRDTATVTVTE